MKGTAQLLLRRVLERAGGSAEAGYVLVLDGEGLEDLPAQMPTPHGTYSVHRLTSEIRLRHVLWQAKGAPVIAVIPGALAGKLPPDLFRRARDRRVHALAPNDVLELMLGVRVVGADAPHLQALAIENIERMSQALSRRTLPTVVDRRLLTELLVDVSVGESMRTQAPAALLAAWVIDPPIWTDNVRRLVVEALPALHGDEGRLLAWAVGHASARERLRALVVHGVLLTLDTDDLPPDVWGELHTAVDAAHGIGRQLVRWTAGRLAEATLPLLGDAANALLTEAEGIARRRVGAALLATSRVLPLAFHDRCFALAKRAAEGKEISPAEIEWLRSHRAADMHKAELAVLEAMGRLSRYLTATPEPRLAAESGTVAARVQRYQRHGAFADLAAAQLRHAMAGSSRYLAEGKRVLERVRERRDQENLPFAQALAAAYEHGLHTDVTPLHRLWKNVVAPVWQQQDTAGVYVVVLDGCSYPVFLDLLYELAQHPAAPIGIAPDADGRVVGMPAVAPLPTVTSHARGALFLGELPNDPLVAETVFRDQQEARTDKARLNQNAALGARTRELFLKGDLTDGGQRLIATLRDAQVQVVAAVFNAIDDQIGSSNTGAALRISPASIAGFRPSLEAALDAKRRVLITADHGHSPFVDNSLRVGDGATPRYQALAAGATPAAGFLEIDVKGLGGPPGRRAFAWKSGVYLGGQQVGFHGGCSLEEMVVPMAWLAARGLQADEPAWWYGAGALPVMEPVRRAPDPTPTPPPPVAAPQLQLFDPSGRADALALPPELLAKLATDERTFLVLLKENGSLKTTEIATRMSKPVSRVNGLVVQLRRKLHGAGIELFTSETLPSGETLFRYQGGST
ncbi:MAG: BREX-2 system phosphatase PglZ [Myxococcales bacterium]|nr:BREX-2 system phosphatase PglZ [Myxococcales bacterium]